MELDTEFEKATKLLQSIGFFDDFNDDGISEILTVGELKRFDSHDHITREGAQSNNLYIILKGKVSIVKDIDRYSQKELVAISAGECIGEIAFLLDGHRTTNLIAETETFLLKINGEKIEHLSCGTQLNLYKKISISLAQKLKNNNQLFTGLL